MKDLLEGLIQFRKSFQGELHVDTKFVFEVNDTDRNLLGLIEYIKELKPDKYTIIHRKYKGRIPNKEFVELANKQYSQFSL